MFRVHGLSQRICCLCACRLPWPCQNDIIWHVHCPLRFAVLILILNFSICHLSIRECVWSSCAYNSTMAVFCIGCNFLWILGQCRLSNSRHAPKSCTVDFMRLCGVSPCSRHVRHVFPLFSTRTSIGTNPVKHFPLQFF